MKYMRKQENKKTKNIIQYFNLYFEIMEIKPNILHMPPNIGDVK